jgi:hypothetical protein
VTLRPSGPLPPSVYWLRRGALALFAVGVVAVVAVVIAVSAAHHHAAHAPTAAPRTSDATTPTHPAATTSSASPSSPSPTATATTACTAADAVTITVTTSARTYPAGSEPTFTAVVLPRTACATAMPSFEVTSGPQRIWDSADCAATRTTVTEDVRTGAVSERWNLERSAPGCATVFGTTTATDGTYHVTATVAGVTSAPVRFAIS